MNNAVCLISLAVFESKAWLGLPGSGPDVLDFRALPIMRAMTPDSFF